MEHARVRKNGVRWDMLELERMVLVGDCFSKKKLCNVEHARVRKSGVRWSMLELERVVFGGTC